MGKRARGKAGEKIVECLEEQDPYRRQKKLLNYNFKLQTIKPLTKNQARAFRSYNEGQNVMMYGCAGTGKTFLGLYFALTDLHGGLYREVIIIRSAVSSRDQGFLPGTLTEKMQVFEAPYRDICAELCNGRRDIYDNLKKKGYLDFMSTSYMRGLTFDDSVIILDEVQNMTDHEINSVLTRIGKNSKVILCGDYLQNDLKLTGRKNQETGIEKMIKVANHMKSFDSIEFGIQDIVRSGFVRDYIIARMNLKLDE